MVLAIALQQDWAYAFPTADNVWIFAKVTSVIYLFNLWSTG